MKSPLLSAALLAAVAAFPAHGQDGPDGNTEKVSQAIVYGDDDCPAATGDEIIVCARLPEAERYRVPQMFRGGDLLSPKNEAWANKVVALERIGRFGTDSCSPVGLGGFTGCTQSLLAGAAAERRATDKTNWQALIADERQKRLAGIDAAAAEVEAAVVEDEKEREARARRDAEIEARGGAPADEVKGPDDGPLPTPPPR
ncbi:MAG: hypothetical protein HC788_06255 [Sphingopyxis sp.]|nr:hypothetical protein [Sphingopyxis sp.]